ncbi:MAG: HDOD domain-containing protein [Kofleriaceae bacterium]
MTVDPGVKKRILFVDDDPAILNALKNLMRKDRDRWDILLADSGEQALIEIRTQHVDVVVSDMRMPYMDGAALLNQIKHESPTTARIMLSGSADPDAIARALPALHQLLAKPCDRAKLRTSIERSLEATSGTWPTIGNLDRLPSPAATIAALGRVLDAPTGTLVDAIAIIRTDPGLAAKVLQLACSEFFASTGPDLSIENAVTTLGLERLRELRATASIFELIGSEAAAPWLAGLQRRSVLGAKLAYTMFPSDPVVADQVYTAALLRNVGRMVLAMDDAEYRDDIQSDPTDVELLELERKRFEGVTHAELGAWLLGLWGLPPAITDLVRFHHRPELAPPELRALASAIHRCSL